MVFAKMFSVLHHLHMYTDGLPFGRKSGAKTHQYNIDGWKRLVDESSATACSLTNDHDSAEKVACEID